MNRTQTLFAMTGAAVLLLSGCAGGGTATESVATGTPTAGGTLKVVQISEPRTLDPAAMTNSVALDGLVGNAIYGNLLVNDPLTGELEFTMATDLSSADGGKDYTLRLRDGVTFSDGTPLTADDVKFNWDRMKDPATGSTAITQASLIEETTVVDDATLSVSMVSPIAGFPEAVLSTPLNWIAKPEVLAAGQSTIDSAPIGAGPFVLTDWARQNVIKLTRNDAYWDAPRPNLDGIEIRTSSDGSQRLNIMQTQAADLLMEAEWANLDEAEERGLQVHRYLLSGGSGFVMNTTKAPFDDPRVREAMALAIDTDAFNQAVFQGTGVVPNSLFVEGSQFANDVTFTAPDHEKAQQLFNQVTAETGKPISFGFTVFASPSGRDTGEAIQAQLGAFEGVEVDVNVVEIAAIGKTMVSGDFQLGVGGAPSFYDPDPQLYTSFHGGSPANMSRIDDPELNAALEAGRTGQTLEERVAAYETVSERLNELNPIVFYSRNALGVVTGNRVGGVEQYGVGAIRPEYLWLQN